MFPLRTHKNGNSSNDNEIKGPVSKNKTGHCTPKTDTKKFVQKKEKFQLQRYYLP